MNDIIKLQYKIILTDFIILSVLIVTSFILFNDPMPW